MTYKDLYNFMQNAVNYSFSLIYETDYEFESFVKSMNPFYNLDDEEYFNTYKNYVDYIDEDLDALITVEDSYEVLEDFLNEYSPSSVQDALSAIPKDEYIRSFLLYEKSIK